VQGQQQAPQVVQEVILFFQPLHLLAAAVAAVEIQRTQQMAGLAAVRRQTVHPLQVELGIPHLQAHHKVTTAAMTLAQIPRHI
jgi:hypothetical protein